MGDSEGEEWFRTQESDYFRIGKESANLGPAGYFQYYLPFLPRKSTLTLVSLLETSVMVN